MVVLRHMYALLLMRSLSSITTTKFAVGMSKNQGKLPTLYWLPKLHKLPYKSSCIANSSLYTTAELSKLLTSCLTAVKNHLIEYYDTCYERDSINRCWSIKNSNEVLNKFKYKGFNDLLNIDNIYFEQMVNRIYHVELQLNKLILPILKRRFWI